MDNHVVVRIQNIEKSYNQGKVKALRGVDLDVQPEAFLTLAGPSGSGKSTLLNLIGALDIPDSGYIEVDQQTLFSFRPGAAPVTMAEEDRTALRREKIGFIFQQFNLVPVLTARENVELPLEILSSFSKKDRRERSREMLHLVGLDGLEDRRPSQLSGGQQQRVAIARALAKKPAIVLADEPTANLDGDTGQSIIELMKKMRDELGTAFVISTHDPRVIEHSEIKIRLIDGRIET